MGILKKVKRNLPEPKRETKPKYIEQVSCMGLCVQAAKQGDAESMLEIAVLYCEGTLVQKNHKEAVTWLTRAVRVNALEDRKLAKAYYILGTCYENGGYGIARDSEKALSYYTVSGKLGYYDASRYVSAIKYHAEKKYSTAYSLFLEMEPVSRHDLLWNVHSDAAYYLGSYFLEGKGVERNYEKAIRYLKMAETYGHLDAKLSLAKCYRYGLGLSEDKSKALDMYNEISRLDSGVMGKVALTLSIELKKELTNEESEQIYQNAAKAENPKKAFELYKQAAELGHTNAMLLTGICYCAGKGVQRDYTSAIHWFNNAINNKCVAAYIYLGECYENGCGTDPDKYVALTLYQKAIDGGVAEGEKHYCALKSAMDPQEAYRVAKKFKNENNSSKALEFYKLAAELGHVEANQAVAYCYFHGLGTEVNKREAAEWTKNGARKGHIKSIAILGMFYEKGVGVELNKRRALELYKQACDLGDDEAKVAYERLVKEIGEKSAMNRLNDLVGLSRMKDKVEELVNWAKYQRLCREQGIETQNVSMHMVFDGNPGTGKTIVARLVGEIYQELGLLSKAECIEVNRSQLVAGYVGQTAIKTQEVIDRAMGGVLFIDEAYTLVQDDKDTFGQEAVDTLLKSMEDNRDRLLVIVAGYTDEMHRFINSNPGLKSRFTTYVHFDDYSSVEMAKMFRLMANGYSLTEEADAELLRVFADMEQNKDKNFANGRDVRTLYESTIQKLASRVVITGGSLTLITKDDILAAETSLSYRRAMDERLRPMS